MGEARTRYLRNAWYAAAWSDEIGRTQLARTFLDEPVVLFRETDDTPVALADRCPHRFAPLSEGALVGDAIQCPYHGLRFGSDGACIHNYHGPVPKAASVRRYPLMERYGVTWIWMGDAEQAHEDRLPDFGGFYGNERFAVARGYLHVKGNYQLAVDNLLDLTHAQFLHPALGNPDSSEHVTFKMKSDSSTVWASYFFDGEPVTPFKKMVWDSPSETCDRAADMRWEAPSNLYLEVATTECGQPRDENALLIPSTHFLTPETGKTAHYFWMNARNCRIDDEKLTEMFRESTDKAFRHEDEPMIALVQERMGDNDFDSLNPVFLTTDRAAGKARQILTKLIDAEHGATVSEPEMSA
ncbi:aromatic ring-hydroxylating dioxygenase subunit alpha [Croceicoccus sediminis]|uniref:aromatic ring-hydroxylating dioxygenase subunit alpha n=1 Tax=Croceicoccus sediminis TaxID=2571150 RepID=UPI0011827BF1|nr:aromatic ring-hydroxylating dioxygenase subunit alpha [Croceicoccus sediminis]